MAARWVLDAACPPVGGTAVAACSVDGSVANVRIALLNGATVGAQAAGAIPSASACANTALPSVAVGACVAWPQASRMAAVGCRYVSTADGGVQGTEFDNVYCAAEGGRGGGPGDASDLWGAGVGVLVPALLLLAYVLYRLFGGGGAVGRGGTADNQQTDTAAMPGTARRVNYKPSTAIYWGPDSAEQRAASGHGRATSAPPHTAASPEVMMPYGGATEATASASPALHQYSPADGAATPVHSPYALPPDSAAKPSQATSPSPLPSPPRRSPVRAAPESPGQSLRLLEAKKLVEDTRRRGIAVRPAPTASRPRPGGFQSAADVFVAAFTQLQEAQKRRKPHTLPKGIHTACCDAVTGGGYVLFAPNRYQPAPPPTVVRVAAASPATTHVASPDAVLSESPAASPPTAAASVPPPHPTPALSLAAETAVATPPEPAPLPLATPASAVAAAPSVTPVMVAQPDALELTPAVHSPAGGGDPYSGTPVASPVHPSPSSAVPVPPPLRFPPAAHSTAPQAPPGMPQTLLQGTLAATPQTHDLLGPLGAAPVATPPEEAIKGPGTGMRHESVAQTQGSCAHPSPPHPTLASTSVSPYREQAAWGAPGGVVVTPFASAAGEDPTPPVPITIQASPAAPATVEDASLRPAEQAAQEKAAAVAAAVRSNRLADITNSPSRSRQRPYGKDTGKGQDNPANIGSRRATPPMVRLSFTPFTNESPECSQSTATMRTGAVRKPPAAAPAPAPPSVALQSTGRADVTEASIDLPAAPLLELHGPPPDGELCSGLPSSASSSSTGLATSVPGLLSSQARRASGGGAPGLLTSRRRSAYSDHAGGEAPRPAPQRPSAPLPEAPASSASSGLLHGVHSRASSTSNEGRAGAVPPAPGTPPSPRAAPSRPSTAAATTAPPSATAAKPVSFRMAGALQRTTEPPSGATGNMESAQRAAVEKEAELAKLRGELATVTALLDDEMAQRTVLADYVEKLEGAESPIHDVQLEHETMEHLASSAGFRSTQGRTASPTVHSALSTVPLSMRGSAATLGSHTERPLSSVPLHSVQSFPSMYPPPPEPEPEPKPKPKPKPIVPVLKDSMAVIPVMHVQLPTPPDADSPIRVRTPEAVPQASDALTPPPDLREAMPEMPSPEDAMSKVPAVEVSMPTVSESLPPFPSLALDSLPGLPP